MTDPAQLMFVANRLGNGFRAAEYAAALKLGVNGWLDEQLAAPAEDTPEVTRRLDGCRLRIRYPAVDGKWDAMDEMRPLSLLNKPIDQLWAMFDPMKPVNGQERGRARLEVTAASLIRNVYSPYQLREMMAQFWHDHFHVNAYADDHIALALPAYDRDVIAKHCLGNFRTLLEAVATSTAMLFYLSNQSSRAGAANENYGRELFELHTLGREHYLNDRYDRWRDVPGAQEGRPEGYIDQDVYEAARAFTGWTVENGQPLDNARRLSATGRFAYVESWHDGYQKRVLATEFDPFGPPMADGRKVLDLLAAHPATARHMANKLCVRLVGPTPPPSLTERVAQSWRQNVHAPDQIAQAVRQIATSPEFLQSRGAKVARPLTLVARYARVMGYDFTPTEGLINQMAGAGQRLFGWPTPTGLPDDNAYFLGSNAIRNRWGLGVGLAQNWWGTGQPDAAVALSAWGLPPRGGMQAVKDCYRLFGIGPDDALTEATLTASGLLPYAPLSSADGPHLALASGLALLHPDVQTT